MAKIGRLNVQIGVDLNKFRSDMNSAFSTLNSSTAKMQRSLAGLQSGFKSVKGAVESVDKVIKGLTLIAGAGVLGKMAGDVIKTADAFNQLQAKVKNSLDSASEFDGVFKKLIASSNRSGTALDGVAQAFVRIRPAADILGISNDQLIKFNETFAKMGSLAGATSAEMTQTMIQLSQGIASNRLGGDELRSVLEQMPSVARTIADSMGIPLSKLKDVAKEGKITADKVFNAILNKSDEVDRQFQQLPPSIDRSMTRMANSSLVFLGKLNETLDITGFVSKQIDKLSGIVDDFTKSLKSSGTQSSDVNSILVDLWGTAQSLYGTVENIVAMTGPLQKFFAVAAMGARVAAFGMEGTAMFLNEGMIGLQASWQSVGANNDKQAQAWKDAQINKMYGESGERNRKLLEDLGLLQPKLDLTHALTPPKHKTGRTKFPADDGKKKKKKTDPDISAAKSAVESVMTPLEKYKEAIKEADRWLKKHLITYDQWVNIVDKANFDTNKMVKFAASVEDLTPKQIKDHKVDFAVPGSKSVGEAMEKFVKPNKDWASRFELLTPKDEQLLKWDDAIAKLQEEGEQSRMLYLAQLQGEKAYDKMKIKMDALNSVRGLGLDLMSHEGKALFDLQVGISTMDYQFEKLKSSMERFGEIGREVGDIISGAFEGMIFQGKSLGETLKSLALNIANLAFQKSVAEPLSKGMGSLFGKLGGSLLSSLVGSPLGGTGKVVGSGLKFFADGGNTPANQPFVVGEKGPELMFSSRPGYVMNNQNSMALAGAGGGGATYNIYQTFNNQFIDNRDFEDRLSEHAKFIGNVSVQAIQRQENRMGRRGPMDTSRG
jgi:tape measure domain-containing protein